MAAAKLVTRCPACRTAFRLVADQLRLRQGLVRCGQCDTVFDAREHLIEVPAPAPAAAGASTRAPATPASTAPAAPAAVTMAAALAHAEQTQATARGRESEAPFEPGFDPGYEVPALDSPTTMMTETEPEPSSGHGFAANARAEAKAEAKSESEVEADASANIEAEAETEATSAATDVLAEAAAPEASSASTVTPSTPADTLDDTDTVQAAAPEAIEADTAEEGVQTPAVETTPAAQITEAEHADVSAQAADTIDAKQVEEHVAQWQPATSESSEVPEVETPLTAPPVPWPTLDHAAFDDEPSRPPAHSSLDPAAAFAPAMPSAMPPSGAYSPKAGWPSLKSAEAPPRPLAPSASDTTLPPMEAEGTTDAPAPQASSLESAPESASESASESALEDAQESVASVDHGSDVPPAPHPFPPTEPIRSASEFLRAADPADPEAEAWAAQAKALAGDDSADLGITSRDGTPDAVARETTTRQWVRRDASETPAGPVFAPDFLRHTRERDQGRTPQKKVPAPGTRRVWMRTAVVVLALGVIVQGAFLARSQLAGSVPVLRPVFEAACAPFGCDVPPWRDLEALRIDSSQLQKQDEATDVYQLAVTLRNQGRATTALPAIELVMTDLQDQLLLRRVLQPSEYLEPTQRGFADTGLRAGSELPVRVRFRTQQAAANYRVLIFYP